MNPKPPLHHSITPPRRAWLLAAILLSGLFALRPSSFAAESPLYIPFQGQVTNQAGTIVADGQYSVIFNLYDQAVGGQPVWSERHVKIGVTRGMINVFLGSISPLTAVDFSQTKYLGITVDSDNLATTADPEMVPRSLIMPAFHAKNSEKMAGHNWSSIMTSNNPSTAFIQATRIDSNTISTNQIVNSSVTEDKLASSSVTTAKIADGEVTNAKLALGSVATANIQNGAITSAKLSTDVTTPAGTVVAYIGDVAPSGWYLCDGSDKTRGGINANLEAVIGTRFGFAATPGTHFRLPDFRGYFLRGRDGSAGRDQDKAARTAMNTGGATGDAIGSVQLSSVGEHTHPAGGLFAMIHHASSIWHFREMSTATWNRTGEVVQSGSPASGAQSNGVQVGGSTGSQITLGSTETRPINAYVNYIIKY